MMNSVWLKQIFKGEKRLLKMNEVRACNPPRYDEISVAQLYDYCLKMQGMRLFFPDAYPKGRTCDRTYFFSVLSTVQPEYTEKLLLKSKEARYSLANADVKKETILMSEEWEAQLKQFPQFCSK